MSIMMRPDSGTKSRMANQRDVNKHINELQQDLAKSRAESQRAKDKLSCLISLVRRSWNGDRNASIHLANIVGLDIPTSLLDSGGGTVGRPTSRVNCIEATPVSRASRNWERLAVGLLQRDYAVMQEEIREYQRNYIENRSRFMDEVMHFHQKDMSRLPLSRPSSAHLSTLDQQFMQHHSQVTPDGRNENRRPLHRAKSAVTRRPPVARDTVDQEEVKLRDLFVESSAAPSLLPAGTAGHAPAPGTRKKQVSVQRRSSQDYDDSKRYIQGKLFSAEDMVTRKPRPMSAAVLREHDQQRARPRSAHTASSAGHFVDGDSGDRPLKYETTRPVSGKRPPGRVRKGSAAASNPPTPITTTTPLAQKLGQSTFITADTDNHNHHNASFTGPVPPLPHQQFGGQEEEGEGGEEEGGVYSSESSRVPISVRVKSAVTRPESVDRFTADLQQMVEMERTFKKNAVALQKKLGLPEGGMV